jgi:hypothetical protein
MSFLGGGGKEMGSIETKNISQNAYAFILVCTISKRIKII